jgi:hypothetical protein
MDGDTRNNIDSRSIERIRKYYDKRRERKIGRKLPYSEARMGTESGGKRKKATGVYRQSLNLNQPFFASDAPLLQKATPTKEAPFLTRAERFAMQKQDANLPLLQSHRRIKRQEHCRL